jgi:DNA-directed RNA polymerase specialized sigma24 family protein
MAAAHSDSEPVSAQRARFATTCWSQVVAAQDADSPQAHDALTSLCNSYWYPLYVYIRRQGHAAHEAEDLTQEFFTRLLEKDFLAGVDRAKGKFRSFLLAACAHFLANQRDWARASKRGGKCRFVSLDFTDAEERYRKEPSHVQTPEKLYARRWGLTLLDQVLNKLREDFVQKGKAPLFDGLRFCLLGAQDAVPYDRVATQLHTTPGAVRVAVHRLRQQFRDLLRQEIAQTVEDPAHIEEEIRDLFAALSS